MFILWSKRSKRTRFCLGKMLGIADSFMDLWPVVQINWVLISQKDFCKAQLHVHVSQETTWYFAATLCVTGNPMHASFSMPRRGLFFCRCHSWSRVVNVGRHLPQFWQFPNIDVWFVIIFKRMHMFEQNHKIKIKTKQHKSSKEPKTHQPVLAKVVTLILSGFCPGTATCKCLDMLWRSSSHEWIRAFGTGCH